MKTASANSRLSLAPLGAGDLIDRAVRFYRRNFWTFILIAAPPIIVGTLFFVIWMLLGRTIFSPGTLNDPNEYVFYAVFLWFGNSLILLIEAIAILIVMGGASRNFVRHLLFDEPITFRETYNNVKKRIFGLSAASLIIAFLLGFSGFFLFYIWVIAIFLVISVSAWIFAFSSFLTFIVSFVLGLAITFGIGWLFFLLASRFVCVPQVMLVEGKGVFSAIGRSANLAGGNVKRLAALFIFTIVATYSALALFYVPLGWYAWANGIEIFTFADPDSIPAWYEITTQLIGQISFILLTPVWMIGLCLLYTDERVRHEGYDIELMAARRLGEIPHVPRDFTNPLEPAMSDKNAAQQREVLPVKSSSHSMLGLD